MANNSPTIVVGQLNDEELKKSIDKLVNHLDEQLNYMVASTKVAVQSMNKSLKSLGDTKVDFGGSADGGSSRRTKAQNAETKAVNDTTASYDQQAQAMQAAEKTASKYSDAIIRQAQAIRDSQQWKEKGFYISGDINYYDPERANMTKRQKEQLLSLEEQILAQTKNREEAERRAASATREEAEALKVAANGFNILNSRENKGIGVYSQRTAKVSGTEDYMGMLQRVLGLQKNEIQNVNEETDSYRKLSAQLKQLSTAYDRLTASERNSDNGRQLVGSMLEIRRAMQEIQRQKSRPVRLEDVLAFQPKNLDQMADKLRELKAYRGGIDITKGGAESEIIRTDAAIKKLTQDMNKYMYTSKELQNVNNALTRSFNYMKNRLAFYFTVGASTAFVKNLIDIRAQYEMNERALGILINSAERGTQIFKELSSMALVSPYTLIELSTAAKQLTAYDVAAKDVVDTTRRLADMAAAVGIPIERLTYALGQIKAYGYLNARDARMFSNAGIPLVKQLSEYYSELEGKLVSTADIYDRIKKKAIGYNDVMQVVNKMTDEGGKFFDFQAKMADTLKVRLANLTLAWNNMLNDIGQSNQGILTWTIGVFRDLFAHWKEFDSALKSVAWAGGLIVALRALNVLLVKSGLQWGILSKEMTAAGIAGTGVAKRLTMVGASLKAIVTSPLTWWSLLAFAVVDVTRALMDMDEAQKQLNESVKNGAKDNYENISKFLEQYKNVRDSLYKDSSGTVKNDIDKNEASKAWMSVKEQIELTTKNADAYIGRLESISNMSERVREGFNLLEDIRTVNAALKDLDEDTIKVEGDFMKIFGITIGDGLITNLKDFADKLKSITDEYGSLENAQIAASRGVEGVAGDLHNLSVYLDTLQQDIATTNESIINFIQLKGWSNDINKISETFSSIYNKIALDNNLSAQQALQLRLNSASAEYDALLNALNRHIADENVALSKARDDNEKADIESRLKVYQSDLSFLQSNTAKSRVYWEDFTKWMSEQHKSEVQAMFKGQNAEQIKMLDFSRGEYNKWVTELAQKYAKEHGMSYKEVYDQLRNYILNANQWSIRIPLIITTQDTKSALQTLKDADAAVDAANSAIERLKTRRKELEKAGAENNASSMREEDREYAQVLQELTDQEKSLADAIAKGGHGKKEAAKARKEQATAEKEVTEAFKNELSILREMKSEYDKLRKAGVDNLTAIDLASQGYENTLKRVNATLAKYGISKFNAKDFLGKDVNSVLHTLEQQRNEALSSGKLKTGSLKELDTEISKLNVSATTFNMERITKGLNNELDKLKDEYELAIDLDATPELGGVFADMMGISKEQLAELPRDFESLLNKMQQKIDQELGSGKFDISANLNKSVFESWVKGQGTDLDSELAKKLEAYVDYANKARQDETKKQVDEWNKLLEKYAEYEYKRKEILETAEHERATAIKKGAGSDILAAIENRMKEQLAQLDFEQFMKTPEWITATGDLAGMSHRAIGMLINDLEHYKKSAKNLSPKQIKQLNNALSKLYKEQRKNNPFEAISNMLQEAKDRMSTFDEEIKKAQEEIDELTKQKKNNIAEGIVDDETNNKLNKAIKRLSDLKEKQKEVGEIDDSAWFPAINEMVKAVESAIKMFNDLGKAIGGSDFEYMFDVIDKTLSAAETGNAIGGKWGAIIGAVVGFATALINVFSEARNDEITESVERSERSVKRLETAYNNLRDAVEKAYGTAKYAAEQATIANKKLQLEELKRQLILERSRDGKHRDEDKIVDLEGQIVDLEREIRNTVEDITNDLLGISSVGSAAEDMVSSMIESFKNGEDWMKSFDDTFADMVDNMIMKAIVGRVIGDRIQEIFDMVDQKMNSRGSSYQQQMENLQRLINQNEEWLSYNRTVEEYGGNFLINKETAAERALLAEQNIEKYKSELSALQNEYEKAVRLTPSDVDDVRAMTTGFRDNVKNEFQAYMDMFGIKFGQDAETSGLSALQAGIQGVTEDTAGAIEAYLNNMSQQAYLRNDLLTEIRDAVVSLGGDIQLDIYAQMLLQLQQSYAVQKSIEQILNGVLTPSGRAFMVELNS